MENVLVSPHLQVIQDKSDYLKHTQKMPKLFLILGKSSFETGMVLWESHMFKN